MGKGELIDSHVSLKQCKKAVEALHSHELKKQEKFDENQILPAKEQHIWLNVTVKKVASAHRMKPVKIPIVHPLVDPRTTPVCLIMKDPQREYKDLLEKNNIKFISRVVGIEKLKGKFKPFEARRMLLKENGMFLADERVVPLLPKLLGAKWFQAKKQPIPVCLTRKDLKGELERAISSTYMNQNQGTCTSIKVGKMSQKPGQILENIKTGLPAVVKAIKGGWENIQSFNIKTNSSMSLPIWSCTLDDAEGGRWHGLQAESEDEDLSMNGEDDDSEEEVDDVKPKILPALKGRKRASSSDEDEEEVEKPKKKAKAFDGSSTKNDKVASAQKPGKHVTAAVNVTPKKQQAESTLASIKSTPPANVPIAAAGKKGQKLKPAGEPTMPPASESALISESENKKKKKSQTSVPAPPIDSIIPESDAPSKKKKANKSFSAVSSTKPLDPSSVVDTPTSTSKSGKGKKGSKTSVAIAASPIVSEKAVKPTLTREEVKQKRTAGVGEKKKEIIAKSKGGKSAKNAVLGKKVAQE